MGSYGYSAVIAVCELVPDMLCTVAGEGVMVGFGSIADSSVKSCAGEHKHIGARSGAEAEFARGHTAFVSHIAVNSRENTRCSANAADIAVVLRSCDSDVESLSAAH